MQSREAKLQQGFVKLPAYCLETLWAFTHHLEMRQEASLLQPNRQWYSARLGLVRLWSPTLRADNYKARPSSERARMGLAPSHCWSTHSGFWHLWQSQALLRFRINSTERALFASDFWEGTDASRQMWKGLALKSHYSSQYCYQKCCRKYLK